MNRPSSSTAAARSAVCIIGNGAIAKTAALGFAQAGHSVTMLVPPPTPARPQPAAAGRAAANSAAHSAAAIGAAIGAATGAAGTPPSPASVPAGVPASAASDPWDARVYALNHTAHTLLSSLKVWDALDAARIAPVDAMLINGDGVQPGDLAFDAFGAHVGALAWIVEDSNLAQALDAALKFAHNVRIVSARATGLRADDDGASVQLDGAADIDCDLIVGADGGQSWVRGQCDIGLDYRAYHQRAVVTNFACEKPHHGAASQWFTGVDGIVALLPLPGQRVSLVWTAPDALADTLMRETLADLAARLAPLCAEKLGALTPLLPEAVKDLPLTLVKPHAIVAPRVVLVGDAAHVVHPLAGHGMNLGFADIAELLKVVTAREEQRGLGDARVLARYARARKEDVLLMQLATDGLARLFGANIEPLRVARNFGLNLLDKLPVLKRRLMAHAMGK